MPETTLQREFKAWVIWFALTASIGIYFVVAYVATQGAAAHAPVNPILKKALIALSCAMAVASFAIARALLPRADEPPSLARPRPSLPFGRWFTILIVRLALHESIALYGLVLAFLKGDAKEMLPFGAAAILLNLFVLPRNPPREG